LLLAEPLQHALVRALGECENRTMQALAGVLLAGLDGTGTQLMQHPAAVGALLARLAELAQQPPSSAAAAQQEQQQQQRQQQAEDAEAAWALCSAVARAITQPADAAGDHEQSQEQQEVASVPLHLHPPHRSEIIELLAGHAEVLCADWSGYSNRDSLRRHQAYVLARLGPLLANHPGLSERQQAALQAALKQAHR
jgi:hypothetical protein